MKKTSDVIENKGTEKVKKSKKNCHEGHRGRLIDLAVRVGIENLTPYQAVELFLTFIFPRGDTNPLSHRLLDEFDNFSRMVDSDPRDLVRVEGLNTRSASMIYLFREFFFYYTASRTNDRIHIETLHDIVDVVEDNIRFRNEEYIVMLAVSPSNFITHKRLLTCKNRSSVNVSVMELTDFFSVSKPAGFAIAHCHPYGYCDPSDEDWVGLDIARTFCKNCGVNFIDSLIIGENGAYSLCKEKKIRVYQDTDRIAEVMQAVSQQ